MKGDRVCTRLRTNTDKILPYVVIVVTWMEKWKLFNAGLLGSVRIKRHSFRGKTGQATMVVTTVMLGHVTMFIPNLVHVWLYTYLGANETKRIEM